MLAGYNYKNLASITLQNAGLTTDTTITIPTSDASILPQTPFYATIMPVTQLANNSNSEIIIATGSTTSGTNTILSVTRAQRNTSAISWNAGEAVLTQPVYVEDIPNYIAGDNITIENEVISFDGGAETVSNTTPSSSFTLDTLSGSPISLSIYGDTYQESYSGKNLLDSLNGFTDGYINNSGSIITGSPTDALFDYIEVNASTEYTASSQNVGRIQFAFYDSSKTFISRDIDNSGTYTSRTVTTPNNCAYVRVWYWRADSWTQALVEQAEMQFEAGSSATSYEPYVGGVPSPNPYYPQTIQTVTGTQTVTVTNSASQSQAFTLDLARNYINFDQMTGTTAYGVTVSFSGAEFTLDGTTDNASSAILRDTTGITLEAGTYTVTLTKKGGSKTGANAETAFYIRPNNGNADVTFSMNNVNTGVEQPKQMTLTESSEIYIQLFANSIGQVYDDFVVEVKIEKDPIELCKIGSYQDYIYKSNGNWYIHKELGSRNLSANTATDNWSTDSGSGGRFYANRSAAYYGGVGGSTATLCSHATTDTSNSPYFLLGNVQFFQFRNASSTWASLDAFLAWLTSNTVMAYYPLATATDTQITDATLISQLEAISLYTGVNAITVSSANLPGLLLLTSYANTINGKLAKLLAE